MSMGKLHSRISKYELDEPGRFDFLAGVLPEVIRVDEVHPSINNDDHYIFLVWVKEENHAEVEKKIFKKTEKWLWDVKILPGTGEGLIIISMVVS